MVRGKYLREKKAKKVKILICLIIILVLYRIIFNSFSLYESEANSTADIDVAFYLLKDEYETKTIPIEDMLPGDTQYVKFTISNFYVDEETGKEVISETDMKCDLKIRTTTNFPLQYELYIDQDLTSNNLQNKLELEERVTDNVHWDDYNTMFKHLVLANEPEYIKDQGITESLDIVYGHPFSRTYMMKITFPEEYSKDDSYQNIMECIEISIDSHQIITGD